MRKVNDHKIFGYQNPFEVLVLDEPSHGNACHEYKITWSVDGYQSSQGIKFQKGPIKEHGVNGISNEALMVIVIDRLRSFQSGDFSCRENALALTKLEESLMWLKKRTSDRLCRGVEGQNIK